MKTSLVDKAKAKLFPEGVLGYLAGPVLALISNSFIANYLLKYYTDVLGLQKSAPVFLILLQVLSVILVVAGNIIVGKLMNRFNTKHGRARPLLLVAIPLIALAFLTMFIFTPFPAADGSNQTLILILVAVGYNLYYAIGYPFYYASHAALVGLSTRDSKARGLLATLSNGAVLGAMGACTMILPFFIDKLFPTPDKAYGVLQIVSAILIGVTAIGIVVEFLFTRERISEEEYEIAQLKQNTETQKIKTSDQWKICSKDKFWWIMIAFFFLYQLGGMLKNASQLYYCNALWGEGLTAESVNAAGGAKAGLIGILGAIPTGLGMVIIWPLSNKIGKGKAILFGGILAVAGGVLGLFAGNNYGLVIAAFIIKALGGVPAMYISLALLADISDHQEAKYGIRCDGLSMTVYGAIMVGMTGIANAIISGVLSAVNYNTETGVNFNMYGDGVKTAMTWIFFGGETICFAIIAILFIFMNVEKYSKEDQEILKAKKAAAEGAQPAEEAKAE